MQNIEYQLAAPGSHFHFLFIARRHAPPDLAMTLWHRQINNIFVRPRTVPSFDHVTMTIIILTGASVRVMRTRKLWCGQLTLDGSAWIHCHSDARVHQPAHVSCITSCILLILTNAIEIVLTGWSQMNNECFVTALSSSGKSLPITNIQVSALVIVACRALYLYVFFRPPSEWSTNVIQWQEFFLTSLQVIKMQGTHKLH